MERRKPFVILGLLSTAVVLLALLLVGYSREDAFGQEAAKVVGPPPLLAVTGACGIGAEVGVLYVIDTEKKQLAGMLNVSREKLDKMIARASKQPLPKEERGRVMQAVSAQHRLLSSKYIPTSAAGRALRVRRMADKVERGVPLNEAEQELFDLLKKQRHPHLKKLLGAGGTVGALSAGAAAGD